MRSTGGVIYLGPENALFAAKDVLEPHWPVIMPEPALESVAAYLGDAIAILDASMRVRFDRATLDRAPGLRVISTATTGADHIDSGALAERSIPLFTLAGETELLHSLTPAAEHSWLLLMACARRLRGAIQHALEGKWKREEFPGVMLRGKTLGLIGCGRIGSWMARYARAFEMDVVGYDPFISRWPAEIRDGYTLDEVLSIADFISIHVPLNAQTRGLIGARELARTKSGAVLINTSRGGVTDEAAVLEALKNGRLGGAGLDVLDGEPAIEHHPLIDYARTHDHLVITPHIGGFCPDAVKIVVAHAARRIARLLTESTVLAL
jgi:phosphoglycerate dehydrogenase-like enzyme